MSGTRDLQSKKDEAVDLLRKIARTHGADPDSVVYPNMSVVYFSTGFTVSNQPDNPALFPGIYLGSGVREGADQRTQLYAYLRETFKNLFSQPSKTTQRGCLSNRTFGVRNEGELDQLIYLLRQKLGETATLGGAAIGERKTTPPLPTSAFLAGKSAVTTSSPITPPKEEEKDEDKKDLGPPGGLPFK